MTNHYEEHCDFNTVVDLIKDEREGIKEYIEAHEKTKDEKLKKIFAEAAKDETKHKNALAEWLRTDGINLIMG